jgi:hypothetical protein
VCVLFLRGLSNSQFNLKMTANSDTPEEPSPPQEPRKPITVDEFDATDFEEALKDSAKVDAHDLSSQFLRLAREADERQEQSRARVFSLLSQVCGIHLRTEDRAEPWGSMASGPGWRTAVPADFKGEQSAAFLAILPRIKNPGLRARLADVAWSNDRKAAGHAAATAVAAYQECADGLLAGKFTPYVSESRANNWRRLRPSSSQCRSRGFGTWLRVSTGRSATTMASSGACLPLCSRLSPCASR